MKHSYFISYVNNGSCQEVDDITFYEEVEKSKVLEKLYKIIYEIDIETDFMFEHVNHTLIIQVLED